MKIQVIYMDGSDGVVTSEELDGLLQKNVLLAFRRSDGWAMVGATDVRDPVRGSESSWKDRKSLARQKALVRASNG